MLLLSPRLKQNISSIILSLFYLKKGHQGKYGRKKNTQYLLTLIRKALGPHWRRKWQPTPVLLPGKYHGQRSLVGSSPWGRQESDTTERLYFPFHFHALEKEMATHSSVLAWRIPGTGEPGGLPSMAESDTESDTTEVT